MKLKNLTMSAALAALVAGGAFAQDTNTDADMATEPPAMTEGGDMADSGMMDDTAAEQAPVFASIDEMTVGDVVGMVAYDPEGERIAEIDYVVDTEGAAAAVLGIGGFLGLGEYTVSMPLEEFELSDDGTSFSLATDKETLKSQPEFDEAGVEGLPDDTAIASLMTDVDPAAEDEAPVDQSSEVDPVEGEMPAVEEESAETEELPVEQDEEVVENDMEDTSDDMTTMNN
ncbi:hypothetical protein [Psychromarinibacter halotolerans]|uniref:PRC-barrel domain protein n=1 Tax=Psychromarinibacter halotolerans TaxID=1775175 RepID=A0ABV7GT53_9RHOB|nr:hypothetical protein [Psychromarinibacter halotolerans]MDF0597892.1 hypothetical protein [Psychromarinibacter halotolerans]